MGENNIVESVYVVVKSSYPRNKIKFKFFFDFTPSDRSSTPLNVQNSMPCISVDDFTRSRPKRLLIHDGKYF